jgi:hypothetical protein
MPRTLTEREKSKSLDSLQYVERQSSCRPVLTLHLKRAIAAGQAPDFTIPVYSTHTIFVLVAPSVFAASIYMCLGRIILITDGEQHSIIRGRWLTKLFVVGDVISFLMQGAGESISGQLQAASDSDLTQAVESWRLAASTR